MSMFDSLVDGKLGELQALRKIGLDPKSAAAMSFEDIYNLRQKYGQDMAVSQLLAPYERQAFARQWTRDNPMLAVPSLLAAIPAEQIAKLVGVMPKSGSGVQTPASMEQMRRGFAGLGEGLLSKLVK